MNSASQYGDLATQLLTESRRSTATGTLFKYNDVLVRSIVREQRDLEARIQAAMGSASGADADARMPAMLLYQTAIGRNKRCLLAYHQHRLDFLKDLYWAVGGALPLLLSAGSVGGAGAGDGAGGGGGGGGGGGLAGGGDVRAKLSPHEVDFLRAYAASLLMLRTEAYAADGRTEDVDLLAPISAPPKDLQVHVRVVRDCGVVHTELGAIDFKRGHRFLVRRADIEHLIVQGYLEES